MSTTPNEPALAQETKPKKKTTRGKKKSGFGSAIRYCLKPRRMGATNAAKKVIDSILMDILQKTVNDAQALMKAYNKRTLTASAIDAALRLRATENMARYFAQEGVRAKNTYKAYVLTQAPKQKAE